MDYFTAISTRCNELDEQAQKYLDQFEFIPNEKVGQRIWDKAWEVWNKIDGDEGEKFKRAPEWVGSCMDYAIPYYIIPTNGSLYHSLGYSIVSQEANLRMLLEFAEGRIDKLEYFTCLAERDIVDSYCKEK